MLRPLVRLISLCAAFAVLSAHAQEQELALEQELTADLASDQGSGVDSWVYIGTRAIGAGTGIVAARLDGKTGALTPIGLVSDVTRATWLTPHPFLPVLYAASDPGGTTPSTIFSLDQDCKTGALTVKNSVLSGGIGATHLAADAGLKSLFVAHFGSGQVSWLPIERDGRLDAVLSIATHDGGPGPNPRQLTPHAHSVAVDPTKRFVLSPDFGADRIFVHRIDTEDDQLADANPRFLAVPPGSGPRHSVFHPNGQYFFVVSELSAEVSSYSWSGRQRHLELIQTQAIDDPSYTGTKSASHIVISRDGRFVYVASRGTNSLMVYSVNLWNGTLSLVQRVSSQGVSPWDFALDPSGRWLLVANNTSNAINEFAVDHYTGKLTATTATFPATNPSNVTFMSAKD